jgi:hypothetical protein
MSKLPSMRYEDRIKKTAQVAFGGLRHSLSCSDGELYDMKNLTCKEYPILQPREKRWIADAGVKDGRYEQTKQVIYADNGNMWDVVLWTDWRGGYELRSRKWKISVNLGREKKDWKFIRFGDRVLLLPGKWLIKTALEIDGYAPTNTELPTLTEADAGKLYLTSGKAPSIYPVYRWTGTKWQYQEELIEPLEYEIRVTGVKLTDGTIYGEKATANTLTFTGISSMDGYPAVGDGVEITGLTEAPGNDKTAIIRELQISTSGNGKLVFSDNCFKMPLGPDGNPVKEVTISGTVTLKRTMPDLDGIFEHDNRLWGWKGKTIYASKLGDPKNWNVFEGLSTDAWALETQRKGEITGGVSFGGYPTFFREDSMIRIYGATANAFQTSEIAMPGVKKGEQNSIAAAGGMLLYLSRDGMMIYADEYPRAQDSVFGNGEIKDALACSDGVRYYARLTVDGEKAIYRYDSKHGLWMKEDDPGVIGMTYDQGTIYALLEHSIVPEQYENRAIIDLIGNGKIEGIAPTEEAGSVESFAEFGDFTAGSLNRKAMSKLQLRMGLETGATVTIKIKYDGGQWETLWTLTQGIKRSVQIPILPRRCDYYRIRIEGTGMWRLYAMAREQYEGSEIH